MRLVNVIFLTIMILGGFLKLAMANSGPVAVFGEWNLFVKDHNKQIVCYMVAVPTQRSGNYKGQRGESFLTVSKLEGSGANPEVSVSSGVIYKKNSNVDLAIGKRKFSLFTIETKAWSNSVEEDAEIIKRMKMGVTAVIEGFTETGNNVRDTYSLSGFTETYNRLVVLCK